MRRLQSGDFYDGSLGLVIRLDVRVIHQKIFLSIYKNANVFKAFPTLNLKYKHIEYMTKEHEMTATRFGRR